ncbi:hypothetical protein KHP62_11230 [Rhodobacteraceae bacterium NNCM2]|nr:hypothetical protein [Coraliihabitans acroporae]
MRNAIWFGALLLGACAGTYQEAPSPEAETTSGDAVECSLAARDKFRADARAAGLEVRGEGEDVDVIARSEAQKKLLEDLYREQLAALEACQQG